MPVIDPTKKAIINGLQGGFPLTPRPFRDAGVELGLSEGELLEGIRDLVGAGQLAASVHCGMRKGSVATFASRLLQCRRNGSTKWRSRSTPIPKSRTITNAPMRLTCGSSCPRRTRAASLRFTGDRNGNWPYRPCDAENARVFRRVPHGGVEMLDAIDRGIVAATQAGRTSGAEPSSGGRRKLGLDGADVIAKRSGSRGGARCSTNATEAGAIRRIGAIPNHYCARLRRQRHVGVGRRRRGGRRARARRSARCDCVSHCYAGRAPCRTGPTTCSPWCTAAAAPRPKTR